MARKPTAKNSTAHVATPGTGSDAGATAGGEQSAPAASPPVASAGDASAFAAAASGMIVQVRTVSRKPRRRAGYSFGFETVGIPVEDLNEDAMRALLNDPDLIVETVDTTPFDAADA